MNFLSVLYLFLPAFLANAAPVVVCAIPWVKRRNHPVLPSLLGRHKTVAGFASGMFAGTLIGLLQWTARDVVPLTTLQRDLAFSITVALLLSAGALIGDAVESGIKRRLGMPSGAALPFWDNVDYMIGGLLFLSVLYVPSLPHIVGLLIIGPLLSAGANLVSYSLGIKSVWH